ncbi:MAG: hypothetical protein CMG66_01345 [Candidatus Marinimicrobia bacterium]|nr:hypothetical protein [Candidatus Neomarinimicrobiota bacterium]|tara:strand:+ start:13024 stop:15165 length:2142 start_codon:yes stop_codon:yes gene_type:complete
MNHLNIYKDLFDNRDEAIIIFNKKFEIIYHNQNLNKIVSNSNKAVFTNLKDIFSEKNIEKIKEKSSLFKQYKSNKYSVIYDNKFLSLKSTFINTNKEQELDFTIISDRSKKQRDLKLKDCVYKIAESSHFVNDLDQLYPLIHKILEEVIYTENFYIATADWDKNIINFPYFIDQYDGRPKSKTIGNGLTEYVLKTGESILVNPDQCERFIKNEKINVQGQKSVDWLGVPLKNNSNETIGAVVVQSYDKKIRFTEEDQKILTFASDQIAMAITRKLDSLEIKKKAYYDQLTGLTNRVLFNDRLNQALHNANREQQNVAVMFVDLDNFKYVNDSMGHTSGDSLLKIIASRLKKCLRKTDTVSRWGGDEFTIILSRIKSMQDISILSNRILNEEFRNVTIDGQDLRITASIGISIYPQDGEDIETLIKNADAAMYKAKEKGKNQFQFFKPKMNKEITERMSNENNLYKAIKNEEFLLLFQPQMDLKTGKIIGFESLVRWNTPDKGILPPYKFIPIAEETNLIIPLGKWIIEQACIQNKKWHDEGFKLTCAVNISAKQFMQSDLLEIIQATLEKTNLNPEYLELELTETILMDDAEKTINVLNKIKEMGVKISIDDFGTGYSSLSYLKKFPIDTLKIDQSFISSIGRDGKEKNVAIANIVIDLGHKLGMKVIAEGVETEQQIKLLKNYACDKIQGYIISEPVNEIEFNLLLDKYIKL